MASILANAPLRLAGRNAEQALATAFDGAGETVGPMPRLGIAPPDPMSGKVREHRHDLTAEGEFAVLCNWLGRLSLLQMLKGGSQVAFETERYEVPTCLAAFDTAGPCLIEVRVKAERTLSLKPDYLDRLFSYARLLDLPLLVAWKKHSSWMLFDAAHLRKAQTNCNIGVEEASRQNLLGVMAGDIAFTFATDSHSEMFPASFPPFPARYPCRPPSVPAPISIQQRNGEPSADVHAILGCFEALKPANTVVSSGERSFFAHQALVEILQQAPSQPEIEDWRGILRSKAISGTIDNFRAALEQGQREGIVSQIFTPRPHDTPAFLF